MNYKISFQECAKIGMELLSKRLPVTLEDAKLQAMQLKTASKSNLKKQRS